MSRNSAPTARMAGIARAASIRADERVMRLRLCAGAMLAMGAIMAGDTLWARDFVAPGGCETFLTVQARACRVSHHYICAADAEGDQWRIDYDQNGPVFRSRINFETEWVESHELGANGAVIGTQRLLPGPRDPASFSELLSAGEDSFEFELLDEGGQSRAIGRDRLTGEQVSIDGVALEVTEFSFEEIGPAGEILRAGRGHEYINRDWRLFFAGPGEADLGDGIWRPIDGSPVDFIAPGEPGFASTLPRHDCDALTAELRTHPPGSPPGQPNRHLTAFSADRPLEAQDFADRTPRMTGTAVMHPVTASPEE